MTGRDFPTRSGCRARRPRCFTHFPFSSSSCAWRRSTRAGPYRFRSSSSFRWAAIGGVIATSLRGGLHNDVYFQIGLLTTLGLTTKNAILIVQFAKHGVEQGWGFWKHPGRAKLRFRPIAIGSLASRFRGHQQHRCGRRGPGGDRHRGAGRDGDSNGARRGLLAAVLRSH